MGLIPSPAQQVKGSGIAAAAVQVTAAAQIQSLAQELPHACGDSHKIKTKKTIKKSTVEAQESN